MFNKVIKILFLFLLSSCAGHEFQLQDARYTGPRAAALPPIQEEQVLVRASINYQRSKLHQLIWGKHYRQVWAAPVPVQVLNLESFPVKLIPNKLGGGLQTTSLSLTDPAGRTYTLRTLEKDPAKSLSPRLQKTLLANIMRDQTSAMNPYGAFTVPLLAKAVGLFHTNPTPYYVPPNAPGLGEFSAAYAGKLTMLEEKYNNAVDLSPAFGPAVAITDTETLFQLLDKSNKHQVDQTTMARARLLDVIIGDWDRHEGQWTWAKYKTEDGRYLFKPIPKDRDYAYYRYQDGVLTWLLSRRLLVGKIKPFIHNIPDVRGLIYKGRALDQKLLNQLSAAEWAAIASKMQAALSDSVIQQALHTFPDTVYQLEGQKTFRHLQKQVERLPKTAQEYYRILARNVTVMGSDETEKFIVKKQPDKTILVQVYSVPKKATEAPQRLYQRVFRPKETKEITLDGLGSADEYILEEEIRRGPTIKIKWEKDKDVLTGKTEASKIKVIEKDKD